MIWRVSIIHCDNNQETGYFPFDNMVMAYKKKAKLESIFREYKEFRIVIKEPPVPLNMLRATTPHTTYD